MQKHIRIAMISNDFNINGINSVIFSYCMNLNPSVFQVTIICGSPVSDYYRENLKDKKIDIIELPKRKKKPLKFFEKLYSSVLKGHFDVVHVHGNSATMAIELMVAKILGVKTRIAHCHSSSCDHKFMHKALKGIFRYSYTKAIACSSSAGEWIFGDDFTIIQNGINTIDYRFSLNLREITRNKLCLTDEFVYGHIGRINKGKNQEYLLKLFEIEASKNPKSKLILVGTGPDYERIKNLVETHKYCNRIILYGESSDTRGLYSSFDCFLLPSIHEGFGIVAIEAQANGLPCIVSTGVPEDVKITDIIHFCSLDDINEWIQEMDQIEKTYSEDMALKRRQVFYSENIDRIIKYDTTNTISKLEKIYYSSVYDD